VLGRPTILNLSLLTSILDVLVVALILGLWIDRSLPAYKVIAMAALAGITATIVDLFVL